MPFWEEYQRIITQICCCPNKSDFVVIEADEFDRSFHWLTPYATVITATDSDHLDIYGTHEAYVESFQKYTSLIQPEGYLIIKKGSISTQLYNQE